MIGVPDCTPTERYFTIICKDLQWDHCYPQVCCNVSFGGVRGRLRRPEENIVLFFSGEAVKKPNNMG
jgi:hypothetical protein